PSHAGTRTGRALPCSAVTGLARPRRAGQRRSLRRRRSSLAGSPLLRARRLDGGCRSRQHLRGRAREPGGTRPGRRGRPARHGGRDGGAAHEPVGGGVSTKAAPAVIPRLDPIIHAQPRLRVVVALATLRERDPLALPRLQAAGGMTAGNLSTHRRKHEEAAYVKVEKTDQRRTPGTYTALTRAGRRALEEDTAALQTLR